MVDPYVPFFRRLASQMHTTARCMLSLVVPLVTPHCSNAAAPITLEATAFPSLQFIRAVQLAAPFNSLVDRIASDPDWIVETLESVGAARRWRRRPTARSRRSGGATGCRDSAALRSRAWVGAWVVPSQAPPHLLP